MVNLRKVGWIGIRSALLGSVLFIVVEVVTNIIKNAKDLKLSDLSISLILIFIMLMLCILLTSVPGFLGAIFIRWISITTNIPRWLLIFMGASMGISSAIVISLPYLFMVLGAHNYWSIIGNPAFPIYLYRLAIAVPIAAMMGGWSAHRISNLPRFDIMESGNGINMIKTHGYLGKEKAPRYLNVEYPAYIKFLQRSKKKILPIFDFLIKDYGYRKDDVERSAQVVYHKEYNFRLEIDKVDGLIITVKPDAAPDIAFVGVIHIINHFSTSKITCPPRDNRKRKIEIMTDDANFYKKVLINNCPRLLSGDLSWWPGFFRAFVDEKKWLTIKFESISDFQEKIKEYYESLK
jgi:hypothetical protein